MGHFNTILRAILLALPLSRAQTGTISDLGGPSGVQISAEFSNAKGGLRDVMFSYDLTKVDHEYSWQFGAAFWFGDRREDVAYIAIQPYQDYIRASFYSFTPGATTRFLNNMEAAGNDAPGCIGEADGVAGVSCHNFLPIDQYNGLFNLSVTNSGGNIWTGKFIDTASGHQLIAGEWTLPHSRAMKPGVDYFLEALRGTADEGCANIPGTLTTFVRPSRLSTGESAQLHEPYPIGPCRDFIHFEPRSVGEGVEVKVQGGSKRGNSMPTANQPQRHEKAKQPAEDDNCPLDDNKKESQQHKTPVIQQPRPQPSTQPKGSRQSGRQQPVPWLSELQHQALCRGYNGNDQACISGYEQCRQKLSGNAFVGWYDVVKCVNRLPK
ncbi:hypothetical protein XA68_16929 [Ophiocordyceps unilateralis]|uniref:Uncharacterized protein n=1 Tax=Ophiocordyceps unilateralis TaxID=268505 RepID=A0A2A9PJN0_OPHUN|nr:hypothetical protein XA68_16929 [Ophiocordyceps unilateralis]